MVIDFRNFLHVLPTIKNVFLRFPLALLFVISISVISLLLIHKVELFDKDWIGYVFTALSFAAMGNISFKLFVESESWSLKRYLTGSVVVTAVLVLIGVAIFDKANGASVAFLSLALALSLMFAPYLKRKNNSSSVWFFNYQLGVAVFFAGFAAVVFGGGLSLILISIEYLFETKLSSTIYGDVWILSWSLLFPVYILANISKDFDFKDELCDFPKGISFIANYILVPLMYAYMIILYAYVIKIIVQWELPKGNLAWMISSFGVIGVLTKLVVYPVRNKGSKLMMLFDRFFYPSLVVPVLMLFVSIFVRVYDYGVTESRYAVIILGVWLSIVIVSSVYLKDKFHIKHAPMLIALLALLASFGPWSAINVSVESQLSRFEVLLNKYELLEDGQAIKSTKDIPFNDRKSLSSIADYLGMSEWRSNKVRPVLHNLLSQDKNETTSSATKINGKQILSMLNIEYVSKWEKIKDDMLTRFDFENYKNLNDEMLNVSGYSYFGRHNYYGSRNKTHKFLLQNGGRSEEAVVTLNDNVFAITVGEYSTVKFDLIELVNKLSNETGGSADKRIKKGMDLRKTSKNKKLKVRVIIEELRGSLKAIDKEVEFKRIKSLLMIQFIK